MKKLFALLLALTMVFSLAATAAAAEADLTDHTYKAYKIFAGTQAEGSANLAVSGWGDGVNGDTLLTALKANSAFNVANESEGATVNAFANCNTATDVAEVLAGKGDAFARAFAKEAEKVIVSDKGVPVVNGQTELEAGYYLVVDTTENTNGEYEAVNLSLLQLTNSGKFEIKNKVDVPEVEKKVDDKNDSNTSEDAVNWHDSADYDIGDAVPFKLTATMPTDLASYSKYQMVFHDDASTGLTFNNDAKVYVVNGSAETEVASSKYAVAVDGTNDFTVTVADILSLVDNNNNAITVNKDSQIVVKYTATLNSGAVIGSTGNPNEVYLQYSNNPNYGGEGETGTTPKDKVIVFTYKVNIDKVNQNNQPLTGANFTLYKEVPSTATDAQSGAAIKASFETNVKATALDDAKYYIVVDNKTGDPTGSTFEFKGVDDGNYVLVETTIPAGYNAWDAVAFSISATHDVTSDNPALTALTGGDLFTGDAGSIILADGKLSTTIENKSGTELPETGGMGTTLFYIVGGIMVAAAVVLLVTKKRMGAEA